jgi:hypothetical protein
MSNHESGAMDRLFGGGDMKLIDIKFCRGTEHLINKERFEEELCASVGRLGKPHIPVFDSPPACLRKDAVDLRAMIEHM